MKNIDFYKKAFDLVSSYNEAYKKAKEKFPYRINIISELHDNENAHSRILLQLLRYQDHGRYTILESFIKRLKELSNTQFNIDIINPIITDQLDYIDGVIYEEGKYAIIIENKIWGASDQNEQITRYVNSAKTFAGENATLIVVYLTMDGGKIVSEKSLTRKTMIDLDERFIPMNYKEDIIPWLEKRIYPNCKIKETYLSTAIYQYVDYLKEQNGMREDEINIIGQVLGIDGKSKKDKYQTLKANAENIYNLYSAITSSMGELVEHCIKSFVDISADCFSESQEWEIVNNIGNTGSKVWFQIRRKDKTNIHLEWYPITWDSLIGSNNHKFELHVEGKDVDNLRKEIREKLASKCCESSSQNSNRTLFSRIYNHDKTLCEMTDDELNEFLTTTYGSKEIRGVIDAVNEVLNTSK